jgi:hypothetical protein
MSSSTLNRRDFCWVTAVAGSSIAVGGLVSACTTSDHGMVTEPALARGRRFRHPISAPHPVFDHPERLRAYRGAGHGKHHPGEDHVDVAVQRSISGTNHRREQRQSRHGHIPERLGAAVHHPLAWVTRRLT